MLSNQILHKAVQDIKRITGFDCAVWDVNGICLVMTNEKMLTLDKKVRDFILDVDRELKEIEEEAAYFRILDEDDQAYVLSIDFFSKFIVFQKQLW